MKPNREGILFRMNKYIVTKRFRLELKRFFNPKQDVA